MHWYDHVRRPIVEVIRHRDMLRPSPGRTEADLVTWIIRYQARLRQRYGGRDIPTEELDEEATQVAEDACTSSLVRAEGKRFDLLARIAAISTAITSLCSYVER